LEWEIIESKIETFERHNNIRTEPHRKRINKIVNNRLFERFCVNILNLEKRRRKLSPTVLIDQFWLQFHWAIGSVSIHVWKFKRKRETKLRVFFWRCKVFPILWQIVTRKNDFPFFLMKNMILETSTLLFEWNRVRKKMSKNWFGNFCTTCLHNFLWNKINPKFLSWVGVLLYNGIEKFCCSNFPKKKRLNQKTGPLLPYSPSKTKDIEHYRWNLLDKTVF
jgi:hypothetical protein